MCWLENNGKYEIFFDVDTTYSVQKMQDSLDEVIAISQLLVNSTVLKDNRYVHHNIRMDEDVYVSLKKNGSAFNYIKTKYNLKLNVQIDPKLSSPGMVHIKVISW